MVGGSELLQTRFMSSFVGGRLLRLTQPLPQLFRYNLGSSFSCSNLFHSLNLAKVFPCLLLFSQHLSLLTGAWNNFLLKETAGKAYNAF